MGQLIDKPWGYEEILETNKNYTVKRLIMFIDQQCSRQYHEQKQETVYVLAGVLEVQLGQDGEEIERLYTGDYLTIPAGTIHRMKGITEVIYLESSTSELDDVVRLEDNYGRV